MMCSLKFFAMICRRGPEIIQFYVEDTFIIVWRSYKKSLFIRNNDYLDKKKTLKILGNWEIF